MPVVYSPVSACIFTADVQVEQISHLDALYIPQRDVLLAFEGLYEEAVVGQRERTVHR